MSDGFDPQVLIAPVLRSLAASSADAAQRNHEATAELAEMAAWDAYALAWLKDVILSEDDPIGDQISSNAADFADAMINRRRKYFGIEVGSVTVPTSRKPET